MTLALAPAGSRPTTSGAGGAVNRSGATAPAATSPRSADRGLPRPVLAVLGLALVGPTVAPLYVVVVTILGFASPAVLPALVGTALYLPAYLRLVLAGARGQAVRHGRLLLLAVAVVVVAVTPWAQATWLAAYASVALCALVVLQARWGVLVVVLLLAAQVPLAAALGEPAEALFSIIMIGKSLAMYALLRLTAATRQLELDRALLAEQAVLQERLRVDEELRRTIIADLAGLTEQAETLSDLPDASGLQELVEHSRRTLAGARRVLRGYQTRSLRSELSTAAALLRAAGVHTSISCPDELPEASGAAAQLRAATVRMLRDGRTTSCTLVVVRDGDAVRLDVHTSQDPGFSASVQRAGAA
jgi:hypothetical protein